MAKINGQIRELIDDVDTHIAAALLKVRQITVDPAKPHADVTRANIIHKLAYIQIKLLPKLIKQLNL